MVLVYLEIVGQHKIIESSGVKPISNFTVCTKFVLCFEEDLGSGKRCDEEGNTRSSGENPSYI